MVDIWSSLHQEIMQNCIFFLQHFDLSTPLSLVWLAARCHSILFKVTKVVYNLWNSYCLFSIQVVCAQYNNINVYLNVCQIFGYFKTIISNCLRIALQSLLFYVSFSQKLKKKEKNLCPYYMYLTRRYMLYFKLSTIRVTNENFMASVDLCHILDLHN